MNVNTGDLTMDDIIDLIDKLSDQDMYADYYEHIQGAKEYLEDIRDKVAFEFKN